MALARDQIGVVAHPSTGLPIQLKRAYKSVAASQTDSSLVAAVTGKSIVVVSLVLLGGATAATTFVLRANSADISPTFNIATNSTVVLPHNPAGYATTADGQALACSTGAGDGVGVIVTYYEE